jgi:2-polyprenyl-6-methoxyphenol hydroxylase-like FAD-dependent oxidoreductase
MLPFQAYDALEELGALEPIRAAGRDIPPHRNGSPVAIAVGREQVVRILREGVDVRWDQEVMDLTRGERVTGVRVRGPEGTRDVAADLVVTADGSGSRVRELAGVPAQTRLSDTAFLSFRSPTPAAEPFRIAFLWDGRQVTLLGWPGGSAGSWQIDRVPGARRPPWLGGSRPSGAASPACFPPRRSRWRR